MNQFKILNGCHHKGGSDASLMLDQRHRRLTEKNRFTPENYSKRNDIIKKNETPGPS